MNFQNVEFLISAASPKDFPGKRLPEIAFAGKSIKDIPIPGNAILVSITRDTEFIIPHGNTVLLPWDRILLLTQDDTLHLLTEAWGLSGK